jgi:hypothetical protein
MGAGERRNDAARRGLPDAERVADGEHQIAHLERVGIADRDGRKRFFRIDLEDREIERLVLEQNPACEFPAVRSRHLDLVGATDDVEVCHYHAACVDQHAGSQ